MSRASELADSLREAAGDYTAWHKHLGRASADELERLERVNAELVEAITEARRLNALGLDCEDVLSAALTSATKEQQK